MSCISCACYTLNRHVRFILKLANSNSNYFDSVSLKTRDNAVILQFSEKPIIHVYLLLKFALLEFKHTLERHARHILKQLNKIIVKNLAV